VFRKDGKPSRSFTPEELVFIYKSYLEGKTSVKTAELLGVKVSAVWFALNLLRKNQGHIRKYGKIRYRQAARLLFHDKTLEAAEKVALAEPEVTVKTDPYNGLGTAFEDLKSAIEGVIAYEVARRVASQKEEFDALKEVAQKSNWVGELRKKFQSL